MRRYATVGLVIVALLLVGYVGLRLAHRGGSKAPTFALAKASYGNLVVQVTGDGTVTAATSLTVVPKDSGTITSMPVQVGQSVKKGQVLATIDDQGTVETQLLNAKSQLASDEESLNALVSPTPATAAQISAAKDRVTADTQRVQTDQQEIQGLTVVAPFSGVISAVDASAGQTVGQGASLFEVVDPSDVTVVANFSSVNLQNVFVGEGAQVTVSGVGTIDATVASIGVVSSGQGRGGATYPVTFDVQSPLSSLRSGMSGTVSIPNAYTYAQGTIEYGKTQVVTSQASGTVESVSGTVGSAVQKGATVMTISSPSLSTQLESDESQLASDQNTLSQLKSPTPPTAAQVNSLKTRIAVDQQNVQNAQTAVADLQVRSPIAGVVTAVNAQVGATTASVSGPLFSVEDPNSLEVVVPIDELSIAQLKVGQRATVTANALPGQLFSGTVADISPAGTNSQGVATFNVTISLPHPGKLMAGMSTSVSVVVDQASHALLVPAEAVSGYGQNATVRVMTKSGIRPQRVTLGLSNDVSAQILSGLSPGQEVVTAVVTSSTSTGRPGFLGGGGGRRFQGGGGQRGGSGGGAGGN